MTSEVLFSENRSERAAWISTKSTSRPIVPIVRPRRSLATHGFAAMMDGRFGKRGFATRGASLIVVRDEASTNHRAGAMKTSARHCFPFIQVLET